MPEIVERAVPAAACAALQAAGVDPVLARVFAARGVAVADELDLRGDHLLPPESMHGLADMARQVADAIGTSRRLLIVGDYDCDGATACAVGVLGLRAFGAGQGAGSWTGNNVPPSYPARASRTAGESPAATGQPRTAASLTGRPQPS